MRIWEVILEHPFAAEAIVAVPLSLLAFAVGGIGASACALILVVTILPTMSEYFDSSKIPNYAFAKRCR
jgi:hypothetical protein